MKTENPSNRAVEAAKRGDRSALEEVVRGVQDRVYHLARRILVDPEDAREATQEILIILVTKLSSFEGRSAFETWVYRVAVNYLLAARKVRQRDSQLSFDDFREDLHTGLAAEADKSAEDLILLNELRVSCTMALLLCLDLEKRLAYVLGDVLELDHKEAAAILDISPDNYRKRLSRARAAVVAFTSRYCSIANPAAKCSCPKRLPAAMRLGRIDENRRLFAASDAPSYPEVVEKARAVEGELRTLRLQRSMPSFECPEDFADRLARILDNPPN